MKKYLIDASVIASSMEDFKRRFLNSDVILLMTDLTFKELEARKKDYNCSLDSKKFVRFLIDLFVKNLNSTEVIIIEDSGDSDNKHHIDERLVEFSKENNLSVLTCDKGMALWCRFYNVDCSLLDVRTIATLPFVIEGSESLYLNLFNRSIPINSSVFVYSPKINKILAPLEDGTVFLNPENIILVAHSKDNSLCEIDSYCVNSDMTLSLIGKSIYFSEDEIDAAGKPFHKALFTKWSGHMKKINNFN